jgi:hypothetical protein
MSMDRCDIHGSYDTDVHLDGCPKCVYDDLLPVCLHVSKNGARLLLDRHNDLIAQFETTREQEECERIVQLVNEGIV